jgi:hypothetical protein
VSRPIFIIGAFRSGTTSIARSLDLADNAVVHVEQPPKLSRETRQLYEGTLIDPAGVLRKQKQPFVSTASEAGLVFGDKNANYLPFIPYLKDVFDCRFVFVVRDGRAVVRSMLDWEKVIPSRFYRRAEDSAEYPDKLVEEDYWDYSLIRPRPGTAAAAAWTSMSHFGKLCWYWSGYNHELRRSFEALPEADWRLCRMDRVTPADILELAQFLELTGMDEEQVQAILQGRINSSASRGTVDDPFPTWDGWQPDLQTEFTTIAGDCMRSYGYWPE